MKRENYIRCLAAAAPLLLAGCVHGANGGPPTDNGAYVARGICFGEGECLRYWRASQPVALLGQPDPASPVVATVAPQEWVEAIDGQYRLVPRRGIVRTATTSPPLAVGDVVYMLEPQGEGFYTLWRRGQTPDHDWAEGAENEPITWDPPTPPPSGAILGWWVKLRLADGRTGWIANPSTFECMESLQGSENCRE